MDNATLRLQIKADAMSWGIDHVQLRLDEMITDDAEAKIYEAEIASMIQQMVKIQKQININKKIAQVAQLRPDVSKKLIRQAVMQGRI